MADASGATAMEPSFITASYVARELGFAAKPLVWGEADRATRDAFHGPDFAAKFDDLCGRAAGLGFRAIDIWVAHLDPLRVHAATRRQTTRDRIRAGSR